jgi:hypothetical protein
MRFFILVVALIVSSSNSAVAQIENPFADVLKRSTEIEVVDTDGQQTALLKQSFNAAHKEMRIRYNYWLQGVGEIDGLLQSIDRLHNIRLEVSPAASELAFVEQKLGFAREIETQCEKANSKAKYAAIREIDEASATAFRIRAELQIVKLKAVVGSLPTK